MNHREIEDFKYLTNEHKAVADGYSIAINRISNAFDFVIDECLLYDEEETSAINMIVNPVIESLCKRIEKQIVKYLENDLNTFIVELSDCDHEGGESNDKGGSTK